MIRWFALLALPFCLTIFTFFITRELYYQTQQHKIQFAQGNKQMEQKNYAQAVKFYEQSIRELSNDQAALLLYARALFWSKQIGAYKQYRLYIEKHGYKYENEDIRLEYGAALIAGKQWTDAINVFKILHKEYIEERNPQAQENFNVIIAIYLGMAQSFSFGRSDKQEAILYYPKVFELKNKIETRKDLYIHNQITHAYTWGRNNAFLSYIPDPLWDLCAQNTAHDMRHNPIDDWEALYLEYGQAYLWMRQFEKAIEVFNNYRQYKNNQEKIQIENSKNKKESKNKHIYRQIQAYQAYSYLSLYQQYKPLRGSYKQTALKETAAEENKKHALSIIKELDQEAILEPGYYLKTLVEAKFKLAMNQDEYISTLKQFGKWVNSQENEEYHEDYAFLLHTLAQQLKSKELKSEMYLASWRIYEKLIIQFIDACYQRDQKKSLGIDKIINLPLSEEEVKALVKKYAEANQFLDLLKKARVPVTHLKEHRDAYNRIQRLIEYYKEKN